jgi:hypothetical protein
MDKDYNYVHVTQHISSSSAEPFPNYVGVGFQSNRMQLNTSILHGATAYRTSTTQLLGNTIPLGKTGCQTFGFPTTRYDCQRSTNDSRDQRLDVLSEALRDLGM